MGVENRMTRRERERHRHIGEILDAAETVFAEKGYEGARMNDIARKAEFSVGYLYQTWDSKEDLYVSLVESKFKAFRELIGDKLDERQKITLLMKFDPFASNWSMYAVDVVNANEEFKSNNVARALAGSR